MVIPHTRADVDRFLLRVDRSGGCWVWQGQLGHGYGVFWCGGKNVRAHRFAHEAFVGEIPQGLTIDHLCKNRACVRPEHLEAVTGEENTTRAIDFAGNVNRAKTHCIREHEFSPENTYVDKLGKRNCRACAREKVKAYYRRNRDRIYPSIAARGKARYRAKRAELIRLGLDHSNSRKTECPNGHPYSAENTAVFDGKRHCRQCGRDRSREFCRKKFGYTKVGNALRTHCPKGHPYSEENTYHHPGGSRMCRTCRTEASRVRYAQRMAK